MIVYVKSWCSWCIEALAWLDKRGYRYTKSEVLQDAAAYKHMQEISGQTKTPTLELPGGEVLADFDVRQLEKFLKEHNINPE